MSQRTQSSLGDAFTIAVEVALTLLSAGLLAMLLSGYAGLM